VLLFFCCRKTPKSFAFDHCFCSIDQDDENFASQELVFDSLGRDILDNAFQGYNACIFAYGQTGEFRGKFIFFPTVKEYEKLKKKQNKIYSNHKKKSAL